MAIAPSSRALCDKMVERLRPNFGNVIELGAGTGKITESLLVHGFNQNQLALFEINDYFYIHLRNSFPKSHVIKSSAENLRTAPLLNVQAVVSGLPFLGMKKKLQENILSEAFKKLKSGGVFIQYTYGLKPPVARSVRQNLGLSTKLIAPVLNNLPPARVYEFRKTII
ncbi:class I SAM-dependent methyltransferase [Amylibacter sp. SFDW26]|uniref:class I SAM-dependent methyltransferase n=1 Tax=Amylibacter sp. SFDW26 TaxID=2652722 RepID=UPI00126212EF|nr:hypothetical protein [Amylibacter sp. SFDW26]